MQTNAGAVLAHQRGGSDIQATTPGAYTPCWAKLIGCNRTPGVDDCEDDFVSRSPAFLPGRGGRSLFLPANLTSARAGRLPC
jgi:hypothetical protein